jgi:hypothetical protein
MTDEKRAVLSPGTSAKNNFIKEIITDDAAILQTTNWIKSVVIGCNFCPFAAKPMQQKTIRYVVSRESDPALCMELLRSEFEYLDTHEETETSFIIFPETFAILDDYLDLAEQADDLADEDYEGVYQVASFHPLYQFGGAPANDAANYTNRSIFPMLHILREESITNALKLFPNPDKIPDDNIAYARAKGLNYMKLLRASCMGE